MEISGLNDDCQLPITELTSFFTRSAGFIGRGMLLSSPLCCLGRRGEVLHQCAMNEDVTPSDLTKENPVRSRVQKSHVVKRNKAFLP